MIAVHDRLENTGRPVYPTNGLRTKLLQDTVSRIILSGKMQDELRRHS